MLYNISGLLKKTKHFHTYPSSSSTYCMNLFLLQHYTFDQKSIYEANFIAVPTFVLFARLSTGFFYTYDSPWQPLCIKINCNAANFS
jgi:hypothetical protein